MSTQHSKGSVAAQRFAAVLRPVLHTFWQAFVAVLGAWWVASGADLFGQISDVDTAKRFLGALGVAALAAALSAAKNIGKVYLEGVPAQTYRHPLPPVDPNNMHTDAGTRA